MWLNELLEIIYLKIVSVCQFTFFQAGRLLSGLSARMRAKEIFDQLDVDGNGEITMTEFVEGYLDMQQ